MKRLKILPSVLMLVLCVGVLCMGIYAASPNSNQITGSITINPANASVNIRAWAEKADGTRSGEITKTNVRNGGEIISFADLDNIANILKLDFGSASTIGDVKPCYIKIEITNNSSTKELGAYISDQAITKEEAEKSDIFTTKAMTNSTKVDATSLEFYKHMGTASDTTSDTATLVLEFKANDFIEEAGTITFNDYHVNIEEYNPNITTETVTADQLSAVNGFVKLSSTISAEGAQSLSTTTTQTPRTSISQTAGFKNLTTPIDMWIVVPNGVTEIGIIAFYGCTALTKISLPNTLTRIDSQGLNASNLVLKTLPESVTTLYEDSFPSSYYTTTTENGFTYKGIFGNPYYILYEYPEDLEEYVLHDGVKNVGGLDYYIYQCMASEIYDPNEVFYIKTTSNQKFYAVIYGGDGVVTLPEGCVGLCMGDDADRVDLTNLTIPTSFKVWNDLRMNKLFGSGDQFSITVTGGGKFTSNLPSTGYAYDWEDTVVEVSILWYTNEERTGETVDKITPNENTITYYPKIIFQEYSEE